MEERNLEILRDKLGHLPKKQAETAALIWDLIQIRAEIYLEELGSDNQKQKTNPSVVERELIRLGAELGESARVALSPIALEVDLCCRVLGLTLYYRSESCLTRILIGGPSRRTGHGCTVSWTV